MSELLKETWFVGLISGAVGALLGSLVSAVGTLLAVGRTARLQEDSDRRMRVLNAQIEAAQKTAGILVSYQMRLRYYPFGPLRKTTDSITEEEEIRLIVEQGTALPSGLGALAQEAWRSLRNLESEMSSVRTLHPLPGPFPDEASRDRALLDQARLIVADPGVVSTDKKADALVHDYQKAANAWLLKNGSQPMTKNPSLQWPLLPDWDLAQRQSIPPNQLVGRDEASDLDKLMLMLSLAFNDLKMVAWLYERSREAQVHYISDPSSPEWGQVVGMMVFAQRQMVAIQHETLNLVKRYKKVLDESEFQEIVRRMPPGPTGSWNQIVQAALTDINLKGRGGKRRPSDLRGWLQTVRNHVVSHYGQPSDVVRGYQEFFYEGEKGDHNASAYFSDGQNMEGTRFFYADAAVQKALHIFNEYAHHEIPENAFAFNHALKHLITAYIQSRSPDQA
ncbi:MAG: hypothetical protein AAF500_20370 [Myxococcota bacterium]